MMRYYCTYFDRNYLARAIALADSLQAHEAEAFTLFAVCLDEISRLVLEQLKLPNVVALPVHEIERGDAALLAAKRNRSMVEYYWTMTPTIILRVIERHPEIDVLTYLDSDLYFYSSPEPIFAALGTSSVLIHEHRYSPTLRYLAPTSGTFNVGLLCFRNDSAGLKVLTWWRDRCNEWCYDRYENGKFGDQLYLENWTSQFEGVTVLEHIGAGVAPWNHGQYRFSADADGRILVDESPLIFYHYHALGIVNRGLYVPARHSHYPLPLESVRLCYTRYGEALASALERIEGVLPSFKFGLMNGPLSTDQTFIANRLGLAALGVSAIPHESEELTADWTCFLSSQSATQTAGAFSTATDGIKVSAIVSAYNAASCMERRLQNLLAQTLYQRGQLEIIVVDSGSPQNEGEIVRKYQDQHRNLIYVRTAERETVYGAWNRAIKLAQGQYVSNQNTDDLLVSHALETLARHLDEHPECALVHADQQQVPTGQEVDVERLTGTGHWKWGRFSRLGLLFSTQVGSQPMWRRDSHDRHGYFDAALRIRGDQEFFLRLSQDGDFHFLPQVLGTLNYSPNSVSQNGDLSEQELAKIMEKHTSPEHVGLLLGVDLCAPTEEQYQALVNNLCCEVANDHFAPVGPGIAAGMVSRLLASVLKPGRFLQTVVLNLLRLHRRYVNPESFGQLVDTLSIDRANVEAYLAENPDFESVRLEGLPGPNQGAEEAALPDRAGFNIIVADSDPRRLEQHMRAYLETFSDRQDICLHVLAGPNLEAAQEAALKTIAELGQSPETIANISMLDRPAPPDPTTLRPILESADLVLGSPALIRSARELGVPALDTPESAVLKTAFGHFASLNWRDKVMAVDTNATERWLLSGTAGQGPALAAFLGKFGPHDHAALLVAVEPEQASQALETISDWLNKHGYDPDRIPDVLLLETARPYNVSLFRVATAWIDDGDERARAIALALGLAIIPLEVPSVGAAGI